MVGLVGWLESWLTRDFFTFTTVENNGQIQKKDQVRKTSAKKSGEEDQVVVGELLGWKGWMGFDGSNGLDGLDGRTMETKNENDQGEGMKKGFS